VLDGILGNQTDLPVTEHATDTHGVDLVFGLLELLGISYRPALADLPDQKGWRISPDATTARSTPSPGGVSPGGDVVAPVVQEAVLGVARSATR
jgi:TnpA family transposase